MTMTPERARELIGHTPGPWDCHYGSDAVCQCKSVVGEHGGMGSLAVISVDNGLSISEGGNDAPDEDQANARLIAAAPDLLAGYLALAEENERLRKLLVSCLPQIADMARTWQAEADLLIRIDQALKPKEPNP